MEKIELNNMKPILKGIPASNGIAIGCVKIIRDNKYDNNSASCKIINKEIEIKNFLKALDDVNLETTNLVKKLSKTLSKKEISLFTVFMDIIEGSLKEKVIQEINNGNSAHEGIHNIAKYFSEKFIKTGNDKLIDKSLDINGICRRIIEKILSIESKKKYTKDKKIILAGNNIITTDLIDIDLHNLSGIISKHGSFNSHIAILARALQIPAIIGINTSDIDSLNGKKIILNGSTGNIYKAEGENIDTKFFNKENKNIDEELKYLENIESRTIDGHKINMFINTGFIISGMPILTDADGVGLYRTETLFLTSSEIPTEQKQIKIYRNLLQLYRDKPVFIRLLDVGGDKKLKNYGFSEENPFLGCRGIRFLLKNKTILKSQISALLKANVGINNLHILLPMISNKDEIISTKKIILDIYNKLYMENNNIKMPKIGIMLEVPSIIFQIDQISNLVDFFSIGTNDLIQYIYGVDRNNENVSHLYDTLDPFVIKMLKDIVDQIHRNGKYVSICGEIAGNPKAIILLIAIGFDSYSMNHSSFLKIKYIINNLKVSNAKNLLEKCLGANSSDEVKKIVKKELSKMKYGKFIFNG